MATTEESVRQTLRDYVAACNAGDAAGYMATLTSDAVFCPPGQPPVQGRDAIGAWVKEGFFDVFDIKFEADFERVIVAGSEVLAPGSFSLDLQPKAGGDRVKLSGTFFNIFREEHPGSWKYSWALWNWQQPFG
jgi:ketosteroid isomerase-like protein